MVIKTVWLGAISLIICSANAFADLNTNIGATGKYTLNKDGTFLSLVPSLQVVLAQPSLTAQSSMEFTIGGGALFADQLVWVSDNTILLVTPTRVADMALRYNHTDSQSVREGGTGQISDLSSVTTGMNLTNGRRIKHRFETGFQDRQSRNFISGDASFLQTSQTKMSYQLNAIVTPHISSTTTANVIDKDTGVMTQALGLGILLENSRHSVNIDVGVSDTETQNGQSGQTTFNTLLASRNSTKRYTLSVGRNQSDTLQIYELTGVALPLKVASEVVIQNASIHIDNIRMSDQVAASARYELGIISTINQITDVGDRINTDYDAGQIDISWRFSKQGRVGVGMEYNISDQLSSRTSSLTYQGKFNHDTSYQLALRENRGEMSFNISLTYNQHD